jgi:hypothetical protein
VIVVERQGYYEAVELGFVTRAVVIWVWYAATVAGLLVVAMAGENYSKKER